MIVIRLSKGAISKEIRPPVSEEAVVDGRVVHGDAIYGKLNQYLDEVRGTPLLPARAAKLCQLMRGEHPEIVLRTRIRGGGERTWKEGMN